MTKTAKPASTPERDKEPIRVVALVGGRGLVLRPNGQRHEFPLFAQALPFAARLGLNLRLPVCINSGSLDVIAEAQTVIKPNADCPFCGEEWWHYGPEDDDTTPNPIQCNCDAVLTVDWEYEGAEVWGEAHVWG